MITLGTSLDWVSMLKEFYKSHENNNEAKKYICKTIYPRESVSDNCYKIEVKTEQQIKEHSKFGWWEARCGKMRTREIINITRIYLLNFAITAESKIEIKKALERIILIKNEEYTSGFMGVIKKLLRYS